VLGRGGLRSHDTRRWQSAPSLAVSVEALERILDYLGDAWIRMYRLSSATAVRTAAAALFAQIAMLAPRSWG
jgi:hypothetical protein